MMKTRTVVSEGKVILRDKSMADAPDDFAWRRDPELSFLDALPPLKMSYRDYLASYKEELRYPSRRFRWFAIDTREGKHIGNCMYYDIDETNSQAEIGIVIGDRSNWDKGYGTDAVKALVNYIFSETGLERIYLNTLESNVRAQRCFEKCGFVPCGRTTRQSQRFIIMELYRNWWEPPKTE